MNQTTITPEQALNNLYSGTRTAPLTADMHELMRKSAEVLLELIKPKEEKPVDKVDTKK